MNKKLLCVVIVSIMFFISMPVMALSKGNDVPVSIKNGDHDISGMLCMPDNAKNVPAVLLLHGTGSQKDEVGDQYKNLAYELCKKGIASLRIDFAGTGDSKQDYSKYTITGAVSDANVSIDYLQKVCGIDPNRIGVVGYSQGGTIAIQVASYNSKVKALCTWAGAPSMREHVLDKNGDYYEAYKAAEKDGVALMDLGFIKLNFSKQWFDEAIKTDGLKDIKNYKNPLLCINGSIDTVVKPEMGKKTVEAAGSLDKTYVIIKNADHLYGVLDTPVSPLAAKLRSVTVDWFSHKL